jgi:hypothetical protein
MVRRILSAFGPALVFGAILVTAGVGAATFALAMSGRPSGDANLRDRHQCFDPKFLRGFQPAGNDRIVITSDENEAYELTLGGACLGLDASYMIGIQSRMAMSDICGPFDADIVYNDFGPRRCPIIAMRHLQGAEAEPYIYKRHDKAASASSAGAHP